jgi:hypothetical protein
LAFTVLKHSRRNIGLKARAEQYAPIIRELLRDGYSMRLNNPVIHHGSAGLVASVARSALN